MNNMDERQQTDAQHLERYRQGEKKAVLKIESPSILHMLSEEGDKLAAELMAEKYVDGDEENGIFISPAKAKTYYDLAGVEFDTDSFTVDYDCPPYDHNFIIKGSEHSLNAISMLVDRLYKQFGNPGSGPLYVPFEPLMQVLVGSPFYDGTIFDLTRKSTDTIDLHVGCENPVPLRCALKEAFEDLSIEVIDWFAED